TNIYFSGLEWKRTSGCELTEAWVSVASRRMIGYVWIEEWYTMSNSQGTRGMKEIHPIESRGHNGENLTDDSTSRSVKQRPIKSVPLLDPQRRDRQRFDYFPRPRFPSLPPKDYPGPTKVRSRGQASKPPVTCYGCGETRTHSEILQRDRDRHGGRLD
ncbi:hypothetical protein IFM89_019130, partial [Coptis chinensis]